MPQKRRPHAAQRIFMPLVTKSTPRRSGPTHQKSQAFIATIRRRRTTSSPSFC